MFALLEQVDGSIPLYTSHVRARTDGPGLMKSGRSIKALIWWYWSQARICSVEATGSALEPELGNRETGCTASCLMSSRVFPAGKAPLRPLPVAWAPIPDSCSQ